MQSEEGSGSTRTIGEAQLLFWVQDNIIRALEAGVSSPARTQEQVLQNLLMIEAMLREEIGHVDQVEVMEVYQGRREAIATILLALYQLYCKRCTTEVKRVRVRSRKGIKPHDTSISRQAEPAWDEAAEGSALSLPASFASSLGSDQTPAKILAHARWSTSWLAACSPKFQRSLCPPSIMTLWDHVKDDVHRDHFNLQSMQGSDLQAVWGEGRWFSRACMSAALYAVLLHSLGEDVDVSEAEDRGKLRLVVNHLQACGVKVKLVAHADVEEEEVYKSAGAHAAILDGVAMIFIRSFLSVEQIHQQTVSLWKNFTENHPQEASRSEFRAEKPLDLEDALAMWMSCELQLCRHSNLPVVRQLFDQLFNSNTSSTVEELQMDISDGKALLLVLSSHAPDLVTSALPSDMLARGEEEGGGAAGRSTRTKSLLVLASLKVCAKLQLLSSSVFDNVNTHAPPHLHVLLQAPDLVFVSSAMKPLVLLFLSLLHVKLSGNRQAEGKNESAAGPSDSGRKTQDELLLGSTIGGSNLVLQPLQMSNSLRTPHKQLTSAIESVSNSSQSQSSPASLRGAGGSGSSPSSQQRTSSGLSEVLIIQSPTQSEQSEPSASPSYLDESSSSPLPAPTWRTSSPYLLAGGEQQEKSSGALDQSGGSSRAGGVAPVELEEQLKQQQDENVNVRNQQKEEEEQERGQEQEQEESGNGQENAKEEEEEEEEEEDQQDGEERLEEAKLIARRETWSPRLDLSRKSDGGEQVVQMRASEEGGHEEPEIMRQSWKIEEFSNEQCDDTEKELPSLSTSLSSSFKSSRLASQDSSSDVRDLMRAQTFNQHKTDGGQDESRNHDDDRDFDNKHYDGGDENVSLVRDGGDSTIDKQRDTTNVLDDNYLYVQEDSIRQDEETSKGLRTSRIGGEEDVADEGQEESNIRSDMKETLETSGPTVQDEAADLTPPSRHPPREQHAYDDSARISGSLEGKVCSVAFDDDRRHGEKHVCVSSEQEEEEMDQAQDNENDVDTLGNVPTTFEAVQEIQTIQDEDEKKKVSALSRELVVADDLQGLDGEGKETSQVDSCADISADVHQEGKDEGNDSLLSVWNSQGNILKDLQLTRLSLRLSEAPRDVPRTFEDVREEGEVESSESPAVLPPSDTLATMDGEEGGSYSDEGQEQDEALVNEEEVDDGDQGRKESAGKIAEEQVTTKAEEEDEEEELNYQGLDTEVQEMVKEEENEEEEEEEEEQEEEQEQEQEQEQQQLEVPVELFDEGKGGNGEEMDEGDRLLHQGTPREERDSVTEEEEEAEESQVREMEIESHSRRDLTTEDWQASLHVEEGEDEEEEIVKKEDTEEEMEEQEEQEEDRQRVLSSYGRLATDVSGGAGMEQKHRAEEGDAMLSKQGNAPQTPEIKKRHVGAVRETKRQQESWIGEYRNDTVARPSTAPGKVSSAHNGAEQAQRDIERSRAAAEKERAELRKRIGREAFQLLLGMQEEAGQDVREAQQESRCLDDERECEEMEAGEEEKAGEEERRGIVPDAFVTSKRNRFLSLSSIREEREGHREDELVSEERGGAGSRQLSERKQAWSQEILLPPQPRDQDEIDKSRRLHRLCSPATCSQCYGAVDGEPSRSERGEEEATESDSVEERRLQKFLALRRRREEDAQMRKQSSMTNSSGPSVVEHKKRDAVLGLLDSCGSETANFCILLVRDPNLRYRLR
ncbi:hypothetical protein GUITHDRAFT_147125 [Guillardia theta CCMP2712]|uniref:Uncharacterized protein n=3 Tax=Guillardia theta TaxID=55529 RepID=L1IET6_GUITC|nr:hypothetical protein GUITHDRAFT_147125 [Guillardia theta CCMP2712]EKX34607.1 hypothetical protein GUITHDRAFT_147125 [Guillardia theta CCMP2712]|eukprot:XP_005821587.1 hypothetical protein GUITHDRAFT_147125 [Guillardia theta CCMP2712]